MTRKLAFAMVALLTVTIALLGLRWSQADQSSEAKFCTMGLAIVGIDGQEYILEDQGAPGPDGCEGPRSRKEDPVIGMDCKIRNSDGEVVGHLRANRSDGLCGKGDPGDPGLGDLN